MYPQLPQMRPMAGPQPGPQGQVMNSPFPSNSTGGNIAQGITQFIKSYLGSKEAMKRTAAKNVERDINNLMLGIPVDLNKTAKEAKKAGFNWDFKDPSSLQLAEQAKASTQQQQFGQAQMLTNFQGGPARGQEVPGMVGAAGLAQNTQPPSPVTQQPQPSQAPSFWQNVKNSILGNREPIGQNSPAMMALQRMQAMGQLGAQTRMTGAQAEASKAEFMKGLWAMGQGALSGDTRATEMFVRSGVYQKLGTDEMNIMAHRMYPDDPKKADQEVARLFWFVANGGPAMQTKMAEIAQQQARYFGGDYKKSFDFLTNPNSKEKPNLPLEELSKVSETAAKIGTTFIGVPYDIAYRCAYLMHTDPKEGQRILGEISGKYPTSQDYQRKVDMRKMMHEEWRDQTSASLRQNEINNQVRFHNDNFSLGLLRAYDDNTNGLFSKAIEAYKLLGKDNTGANEAMDLAIAALNKKNNIQVQLPGMSKPVSFGVGTVTRKDVDGLLAGLFTDPTYMFQIPKQGMNEDQRKQYVGTPKVPSWVPEDLHQYYNTSFLQQLGSIGGFMLEDYLTGSPQK